MRPSSMKVLLRRRRRDGQFIPVLGPTMVRTGVGDPDLASWPLLNSTAVGLSKLETHTSPEEVEPVRAHRDPAAPKALV